MKRYTIQPRDRWQETVEKQGFMFHTSGGRPYWGEDAYYEFNAAEIDLVEEATNRLNEMALLAADYIIQNRKFDQLGIPPEFHDFIVQSWEQDEISVIGRFDLAYDGENPPKMLEYNADTPTSLLEAAVVQWYWLKDCFPDADQFNSIHERLIEAWERVKKEHTSTYMLHFCALNNWEDIMNTTYLRDTATQAGILTSFQFVKEIGWNEQRECFTDKDEREVRHCFKLYPWEWMIREDFGPNLLKRKMKWYEPPWKMVLSNKGILPVMWKLFPNSPYLLEASYEPISAPYVKKPFLSREGANVELEDQDGAVFKTEGKYGDGPFIYQRYHRLANFDGYYAVLGSWMVNGYACGMGIREDQTPISGNLSRFVPHLFK